jgi:ADP-ribosylglycohydrolase
MTTRRERAIGALVGLAVGDALGMPTQGLSPERIRSTIGRVTGLLPAPPDHPIAAGLPAGSVTDDTEQALLRADLLI